MKRILVFWRGNHHFAASASKTGSYSWDSWSICLNKSSWVLALTPENKTVGRLGALLKKFHENTHDYIKHLECSLIVSNDISFVRQLAPSASQHPLTSLLLWRPSLAPSTPPATLQLSTSALTFWEMWGVTTQDLPTSGRWFQLARVGFALTNLLSARHGKRDGTEFKYPWVIWFTSITNTQRCWELSGTSLGCCCISRAGTKEISFGCRWT